MFMEELAARVDLNNRSGQLSAMEKILGVLFEDCMDVQHPDYDRLK